MSHQQAASPANYVVLGLYMNRNLNSSVATHNSTMTNLAPAHAGVNVLLGGAMMSCILIMLVCICYLCHARFQKTNAFYEQRQSWIENAESETSIHIFTLERQCYEHSSLQLDRETIDPPPPDYDDVIAKDKELEDENDPDLPSYETALKLSSTGYV